MRSLSTSTPSQSKITYMRRMLLRQWSLAKLVLVALAPGAVTVLAGLARAVGVAALGRGRDTLHQAAPAVVAGVPARIRHELGDALHVLAHGRDVLGIERVLQVLAHERLQRALRLALFAARSIRG